jgi:hypothetical protein
MAFTPIFLVGASAVSTGAYLVNLISYWGLEEASGTRNDSFGTNHLTDNAAVTSTTGQVGNSAVFAAASSQFLSRASNASLQCGNIDFTFVAWVKLTTLPAASYVVLSKDLSTGNRNYALDLANLSGDYRFRFYINGAGGGSIAQWTSNTGTTGQWYFVVAWHDSVADTINIQVNNGTPASTATANESPGTGTEEFRLGAYATVGAETFLNGQLDEVGFWKRVLTPTERADLYNAGAGRNWAYINAF